MFHVTGGVGQQQQGEAQTRHGHHVQKRRAHLVAQYVVCPQVVDGLASQLTQQHVLLTKAFSADFTSRAYEATRRYLPFYLGVNARNAYGKYVNLFIIIR